MEVQPVSYIVHSCGLYSDMDNSISWPDDFLSCPALSCSVPLQRANTNTELGTCFAQHDFVHVIRFSRIILVTIQFYRHFWLIISGAGEGA